MNLQPRNLVMVVNDINVLRDLLAQEYKVLLCTEDQFPPDITMHPNIIKCSILLPPFEAVSIELDNQLDSAYNNYMNYLNAYWPAMSMSLLIYISILKGQPMVLYFGSEFPDIKILQYLPQFFQSYIGITFAPNGQGAIDIDKAPYAIDALYMQCEIQALQALSFMPIGMDFLPTTVDKMIVEMHPPIMSGDIESGNKYFKELVKEMNGQTANAYGQRYYSPFSGGHFGGGPK